MDGPAPLDRRSRRLLTLAFAVGLALTAGYVVRLALEPHAGFDVPTDGVVSHVAEGSAADAAGLRVGDRLADGEATRWRSGSGPSSIRAIRDGRVLTLDLPRQSPTLARRLVWLPWYRVVLIGVGLAALGLGAWIVSRNPDAPGMVPLALSTAAAAPVYAAVGPSLVWTAPMVELHTIWDVVVSGLFQAFSVHWLLSFPRRVGGRGAVVATYAAAGVGIAVLLALALGPGGVEAWIYLRAGLAALTILVLCVVQLARAPTQRTRQQAAWVLAAVAAYSTVDLFLWELPGVAGIPAIGSTGTVNAIVGLSYLLIPAGIGIAVTREGLFGIDRFVTPGLAYGATVVLLVVAYAGLAAGLAEALGRASGSLPTAVAVALAAALFALLVPVQRRLFAWIDRVFNRHERARRATLSAFEARVETAQSDDDLRAALAETIRDGLDLDGCAVHPEASAEIVARPGVLDVPSSEGVRLDAALAEAAWVPLGTAGTARLGRRLSGAKLTEDHLSLLAELGRRFGRAAERLRLLRELSARELEVARTRLRIAGDLHDDIGASLSSMAVLSDLVRRNDALPEADRSRLDRLSASARTLVDDLRDIVWAIDPSSDRLHDLAERLRDTAAALLPGVACTVEAPDEADLALDMEVRRHLLLVAKEALHNVARHAGATAVRVRLAASSGAIGLTVADDGRGFDASAGRSGHGLSSLRERAALLGGTLTVDSQPGGGTRVHLYVPRDDTEAGGTGTTRTRRAPGGDGALS
jgi:signal transduction histidine kinase